MWIIRFLTDYLLRISQAVVVDAENVGSVQTLSSSKTDQEGSTERIAKAIEILRRRALHRQPHPSVNAEVSNGCWCK